MKTCFYSVIVALTLFCAIFSTSTSTYAQLSPDAGPASGEWRVASIGVYLDQQILMAYGHVEGQTRSCRVSTGKPASPTPTGEFKVEQKYSSYHLKAASAQYGREIICPNWLMIESNRGIGIHGVPGGTWHGGYPSSAGCIRVREREDAEWLFRNTAEQVTVTISGSTGEYIANNKVFPWQRSEVQPLLVQHGAQWGFKKSGLSEAEKAFLVSLIKSRELRTYRPSPAHIKKDSRWKELPFFSFPSIPEMSPAKLSYSEASERFFSVKEAEDILGITLTRNTPK